MKRNTRAVITGGAGFLGSHLAQELASSGYGVMLYGPERPELSKFDYVEGDIRDRDRLRYSLAGADIVFHLAGAIGTDYLIERAREAVDVNIGGTLDVYDLARELGFTVVDVGVIPDWLSPYMITKKASAKFGAMYHTEFQTDIRVLELSHVYGPGQRVEPYNKAIPTFISRALRDEPLTVYGKGSRPMDCIYVKDAVKALKLVGECTGLAGKIIPLGSGEAVTVLGLARKIIDMTHSSSEIVFAPMRRGEPSDQDLREIKGVDLSAWRAHFDWQPETNLDAGLKETIPYYARLTAPAR